MSDVIKEYYDLVKEDEEYLKKYILKNDTDNKMLYDFRSLMQNQFEWRKIKEIGDISKKNICELLKIEDYYDDELTELFAQYFGIKEWTDKELDKYFSNTGLNKLLENADTPQEIKECIKIYFKAKKVCKKLHKKIELERT